MNTLSFVSFVRCVVKPFLAFYSSSRWLRYYSRLLNCRISLNHSAVCSEFFICPKWIVTYPAFRLRSGSYGGQVGTPPTAMRHRVARGGDSPIRLSTAFLQRRTGCPPAEDRLPSIQYSPPPEGYAKRGVGCLVPSNKIAPSLQMA